MEFKLATESDRSRLMGYVAGLDLSKPKTVSVKDEKRSDASNRRMWAMLRDGTPYAPSKGEEPDAMAAA